MTAVSTASSMDAFKAAMRRDNYLCIQEAMEVLAPETGKYSTRAHLPMQDGSICVDYSKTDRGVDYEHTANIDFTLIPGLARIALGDIRYDSDNKSLQSRSIRYFGKTALVPSIELPLDGFELTIQEDGLHILTGVLSGAEVPLTGVTEDHTDLLALPFLGILSNRAGLHGSSCPPPA